VYDVPDRIAKLDNSCKEGYDGNKGCFYDFLPHNEEKLSVKEIIEKSSNVGTIKILDVSSVSEIEDFLLRFGFNSRTGVEVPGEIKGNFQSYKKCKTCLASMSIGYSIGVTQIQMVKAYGIIANGGIEIHPTLIKKDREELIPQNRVISNELAKDLKMLLINVVDGENGTARAIKRDDLVIGGKTGTSKSYIENQNYSESKYNTSFTGFFESENGPIVTSVILWHAIDSQRSEYVTGGSTAAPIFSEIVDNIIKRDILEGK
jgi:cell division protein FtsI/penicillin-binding protein 2